MLEVVISLLLYSCNLVSPNCTTVVDSEYSGIYENTGFIVQEQDGKRIEVSNDDTFYMCEVESNHVVLYAYAMFFPKCEYGSKLHIQSEKLVKIQGVTWLQITFREYPTIYLYIQKQTKYKYILMLLNTSYSDELTVDIGTRIK